MTDEEWSAIEPLLPKPAGVGSPRRVDMREVLSAIRFLVRSGCAWSMLPVHFPPWQTVSWWFRRLARRLTVRTIHDVAQTAQMLGIALGTIGRLKAAGHLRVRAERAGKSNPRADLYVDQDVLAFAEKCVSIHNHALALGTPQDMARRRSSDRGVEPGLTREVCGADFYIRSEIGD